MNTIYYVTDGQNNFICTEAGLTEMKKNEYIEYAASPDNDELDPNNNEINEYEFNRHYTITKLDIVDFDENLIVEV